MLDAGQARNIAEEYHSNMNNEYKFIGNTIEIVASLGEFKVAISREKISDIYIDEFKEALEKQGYSVVIEDECLDINWREKTCMF